MIYVRMCNRVRQRYIRMEGILLDIGLVLTGLLNTAQCILFLIGIYYLFIAFFSLMSVRREKKTEERHSFALIVAAHNEEKVIRELVESLNGLEYPRELFDVFVVADNCEDKTAAIARAAGANVIERFNKTQRGKGYAMEYAFEHIFAMEKQHEYICVFDADNVVKNDFLIHMNNKINEGYRAVQGYLDSKNPNDSWLTFSYSLWYWINNRISQFARSNLDFGCRLGGTGFAVESDLIKKYGWGATCLAEDTEFTLKLALNDIKVGWCHKAVVYDEKPTGIGTSMHQRKRWAQGIADVASRYIKPLAQKAVKEKKAFPFHMIMNFFGDTLYSFSFVFFTVIYFLAIMMDKTSFIYTTFCTMWAEPQNMLMLTVFVWANVVVGFAGLYNDGKLNKNIAKNGIGFLLYIISWVPVGIIGFFKKNEKEWFHTPHSSSDKTNEEN